MIVNALKVTISKSDEFMPNPYFTKCWQIYLQSLEGYWFLVLLIITFYFIFDAAYIIEDPD